MKHIFITGEIGVGKSTLVSRLLPLYNRPEVFGFYTKKQPPDKDGNFGIYIHPARAKERSYTNKNLLAYVTKSAPKQRFNEVFNGYGASLITGIPKGSLVVMDELGVLENSAFGFQQAVFDVLDGGYLVLGVIKPKDSDFLNGIRAHKNVAVYPITPDTREEAYQRIMHEQFGVNNP